MTPAEEQEKHYFIRRVGSKGHEILDANGQVIAWAVDDYWATLIARALSEVADEA